MTTLPSEFRDIEDNVVSLDTLCRREPAWAANRIRKLHEQLDVALRIVATIDTMRNLEAWSHNEHAIKHARRASEKQHRVWQQMLEDLHRVGLLPEGPSPRLPVWAKAWVAFRKRHGILPEAEGKV